MRLRCPYLCTSKPFAFNDCITQPGHEPEDGDIGCCAVCGGWWILVNGVCEKYDPTLEEMKMVVPEFPASRERARQDAEQRGKRLL